jgi:hypothetical protein
VLDLAGVDLPLVNAFTAVFLILSGVFLVGTVVVARRREKRGQAEPEVPASARHEKGTESAPSHFNV